MPEIEVTETQLEDAQQNASETDSETDEDYTWLTERLDAQENALKMLTDQTTSEREMYRTSIAQMEQAHREQMETLTTMVNSLTAQNTALQTAQAQAFETMSQTLSNWTQRNSNNSSQTETETEIVTEQIPVSQENNERQEDLTSAQSKRRRL
jgi:hypothetical protein